MDMSDYLIKSKQYKGFHYSILEPEMLDYLHQKTLEMFKAVKTILDSNDIPYMICGGTLLGAVTTGHFIPWDDDVDMCVPEEFYDKMKRCLLHSLPNWIEVQCSETEPHYYHGWVKIRDKKSVVEPNEPFYKENGVWVDIYMLTKSKYKDVEVLINQEHIEYLNRRCTTGCISEEERDKRIKERNLVENFEKYRQNSINNKDDRDVYIIRSASKILIDPEWCFPLSNYISEGENVTSFNNPDSYLVRHYGENYRELPPEELRRVGIKSVRLL
jgi:lipopolysaccharide cholinephosphotransferase